MRRPFRGQSDVNDFPVRPAIQIGSPSREVVCSPPDGCAGGNEASHPPQNPFVARGGPSAHLYEKAITDLHRGQIIAQPNHVSLLRAADVTLPVVTLTVSMGVLLFGMHQIRKEGS